MIRSYTVSLFWSHANILQSSRVPWVIAIQTSLSDGELDETDTFLLTICTENSLAASFHTGRIVRKVWKFSLKTGLRLVSTLLQPLIPILDMSAENNWKVLPLAKKIVEWIKLYSCDRMYVAFRLGKYLMKDANLFHKQNPTKMKSSRLVNMNVIVKGLVIYIVI